MEIFYSIYIKLKSMLKKRNNRFVIIIYLILMLLRLSEGINIGIDIEPTRETLLLLNRVLFALSIIHYILHIVGSLLVVYLANSNFLSKGALAVLLLSIFTLPFSSAGHIVITVLTAIFIIVIKIKIKFNSNSNL